MIYLMILLMSFIVVCFSFIIYFYCYSSKRIKRIRDIENIKRLYANKIVGKKRMIVGGSDVLYAFNTDKMNKELKVPTVNFGLNVGLGMGYLLDFAKENLKSGDQVIICMAYSLYYKKAYDIFAYEYYRMYDRKKLKYFSMRQQLYFLLANLKLNFSYVQKQFELSDTGSYVNMKGSKLENRKNKPLCFPKHFEETDAVRYLIQFRNYCIENQIDIKLTFPSTLFFKEYRNCIYIQELVQYVSREFECIGDFESYLVPKSHIYDSVYHLNKIGQLARTDNLINYLKSQEV